MLHARHATLAGCGRVRSRLRTLARQNKLVLFSSFAVPFRDRLNPIKMPNKTSSHRNRVTTSQCSQLK